MDLQKIVIGCKNQEPKAQEALYNRYFKMLFGVALRYLSDVAIVEELIADSFLKIFQKISTFEYIDDKRCYSWMKTILINECLMYIRQKKWIVEDITTLPLEFAEPELAMSSIGTKEIMQYIRELPQGYRTVFNLFALEGHSHQEIAQLLQISEQTSKSQLFKARKQLQERIKTQH